MSDTIFVVGLTLIGALAGSAMTLVLVGALDDVDPIGWLINLGRSARQTSREIDSFERGARLPTARVVRR